MGASVNEEYRADVALVSFWLVLCGIPIPISIAAWIARGWYVAGPLISVGLLLPMLVLIFVSRFKVSFTDREFVYQHWGPTIRIAYTDIVGLEVTNVTPLERQAIGAFVVVKNGRKYPFWPKLFPRRAVERFFELGPLDETNTQ